MGALENVSVQYFAQVLAPTFIVGVHILKRDHRPLD